MEQKQITKASGNGEQQGTQLVHLLQKMAPEIVKAVPKHLSAERMTRITLTALRQNPKLAQCTAASFLGSVMQLCQLGLEPNTVLGQAYLIPRQSKKTGTMECTIVIGYGGMISLAYRSGMVDVIDADVVREGDKFSERRGTSPCIEHEPSQHRAGKPLTHVYAVAWLKGATRPLQKTLTRGEVDERRARSAQPDSGPWKTDYEAMARKTAIRSLWPLLPKASELTMMSQAAALDEAPEYGKAQSALWTPDVADALERNGVTIDDEVQEEE